MFYNWIEIANIIIGGVLWFLIVVQTIIIVTGLTVELCRELLHVIPPDYIGETEHPIKWFTDIVTIKEKIKVPLRSKNQGFRQFNSQDIPELQRFEDKEIERYYIYRVSTHSVPQRTLLKKL